jgi:hypothetical protein
MRNAPPHKHKSTHIYTHTQTHKQARLKEPDPPTPVAQGSAFILRAQYQSWTFISRSSDSCSAWVRAIKALIRNK